MLISYSDTKINNWKQVDIFLEISLARLNGIRIEIIMAENLNYFS